MQTLYDPEYDPDGFRSPLHPGPDGKYEVILDPHGLSPENTTRFRIVGSSPEGRYCWIGARLQAASGSGRPVLLRDRESAGHSAGRGLAFGPRVEYTALGRTSKFARESP